SGFGISATAKALGKPADTRAIFTAAEEGADWALSIVGTACRELANALINIQALVDPDAVILAGGIGSLPLYRRTLQGYLECVDDLFRPNVIPASLGKYAGAIGIADMALCRHRTVAT